MKKDLYIRMNDEFKKVEHDEVYDFKSGLEWYYKCEIEVRQKGDATLYSVVNGIVLGVELPEGGNPYDYIW